jgi:hypothetical protein
MKSFAFEKIETYGHIQCARKGRRERAQIGAAALDVCEDIDATLLKSDIIRSRSQRFGKLTQTYRI